MTVVTVADIEKFLAESFPQMTALLGLEIENLTRQGARIRLPAKAAVPRAGGMVSGPTLMMLADVAMYISLLGVLGPEEHAYTSSLHINFLRKTPLSDLIAETHLLKLGRTTAVGTVNIAPDEAGADLVAAATVTYALPS